MAIRHPNDIQHIAGSKAAATVLKNLTEKNKPTMKFLILIFVCVLRTCP
jgi:hypothetical protein